MGQRTMTQGARLLLEWRKARNLTQHQVCIDMLERLDQSRYSAFENGRARPGLVMASMIEAATSGKVPSSSWLVVEAAKRRRVAA